VNTLLLTPEELGSPQGGRVRLPDDRRVAHVRTVHRAAVGDRLRVGVVGGRLGTGVVVAFTDTALELDVVLDRDPPPPVPLVVVLALPRPKVMRRVLQTVATLGVKRLCLTGAWRVEKSYWESPMLEEHALHAQLVLGLEQACDTELPVVTLHRRFKPFVEDELPKLANGHLGLVAHPAATRPCPRAVDGPVTLAIGPEGGFTDYELGALAAQGLAPVSIGPRVLRVEQVVPALVGRLF
jgi:16S rRNA (uracil1498-N3)-methyltransferase